MRIPVDHISRLLRSALLVFLYLSWLLAIAPVRAETTDTVSGSRFPEEFGEIIYQTRHNAPCRIFIIAASHRSPISGGNGSQTLQAQIETFRIGEWLIRKQQIDTLLPEGFFGRWEKTMVDKSTSRIVSSALEQRLADTSVFANAELLLHEAHGIGLQQIEDRSLYLDARKHLRKVLRKGSRVSPSLIHELDYLQWRRSAAILQGIPAALAKTLPETTFSRHGAILTIGLSHLEHILTFLQAGEIRIPAPISGGEQFPAMRAQLELHNSPIDITVIIPRSLLQHPLVTQNARS